MASTPDRHEPADEPLLLTARDAARLLACSERTLWKLTDTQEIPCVRIGRAVRYALEDLKAFVARKRST